MIKKLFGGKSKGFFLELNESEDGQSTKEKVLEAVPETVTKAVEEVAEKLEPVKKAVTKATEEVAEKLEPVTEAVKEAVTSESAAEATEGQPPEAAEAQSAKKSNKTSIKNRKKTATQAAASPSSKPASVSSGRASASSYEPPFWVKAMYNSSSNGGNGQIGGGQQTFATDNLLPTPSRSRRRPGPSLNKFKEMARQAKTPRR